MLQSDSSINVNDSTLITLVNTLQDIFASVAVHNPIDLPQIAIIGSQCSDKSSVLENIVGRDFLPQETNFVTRRPLILQLINQIGTTQNEAVGATENKTKQYEWGEFLHLPGQKFHDIDQIRQVIKETNLITGRNEGISSMPISLVIYSSNVPTLTLVDLPGLTKVLIGNQPTNIEEQIRDMVLKQITKRNTIILATTAANTDLTDSEGLKLAREVDPDGQRTICVLTKADTMDDDTDLIDILPGQIFSLRLGYIPIISRRKWDIENNKDVSVSLESEKNFFDSHRAYRNQSSCCGTAYLARRLHQILIMHIKQTLPKIKNYISLCLREHSAELKSLGGNLIFSNSAEIVLNCITEFCNEYRKTLEGKNQESSSNEFPGGARLSFIFHELYSNTIEELDPSDYIKDTDIRLMIYCCSGSCLEDFADTAAFESIAKFLAKKLKDPSIDCVALVHEELVRILDELLRKPVFQKYPELEEKFRNVVVAFFMKAMDSTTKLVRDLVNMEACYINTRHPDFLNGHRALAIVNECHNASNPVQVYTKTGNLLPVSPVPSRTLSSSEDKMAIEAPVPQLKESGTPRDNMRTDVEVFKLLLTSYFNITRRTMIDMVPKAIMLNLVARTKAEMPKELLENLYHSQQFENLLKESEHTIRRHKECQQMVECLTKASEIISPFC